MPTISIIMPIYNVEKYLRECLDSVRAQTFTDWECICVDDGSTDSSPAILDEYAAKDSRFRVIRREHSNAGAVRNFGMTKATGDYLAFLDSDDVFSPWMLETLFAKAEETKADVAACSATWFLDGTPAPTFTRPERTEWKDRTPDPDWTNKPLLTQTMPWNKIIRRQFVENLGIRFLEQSSTNDFTFMALTLSLSAKTLHTQVPLVGYRQHTRSIQSKKSKNSLNYLRAIESYREQMVSLGAWQKLSPRGSQMVFEACAGSAIWELETQMTFAGYRALYHGLIEDHPQWQSLGVSVDAFCDPSPRRLRYRTIVRGGTKEHLKAFCEALLAPLLGSRQRSRGWKASLGHRLSRLLWKVFDSPARYWNRLRSE